MTANVKHNIQNNWKQHQLMNSWYPWREWEQFAKCVIQSIEVSNQDSLFCGWCYKYTCTYGLLMIYKYTCTYGFLYKYTCTYGLLMMYKYICTYGLLYKSTCKYGLLYKYTCTYCLLMMQHYGASFSLFLLLQKHCMYCMYYFERAPAVVEHPMQQFPRLD